MRITREYNESTVLENKSAVPVTIMNGTPKHCSLSKYQMQTARCLTKMLISTSYWFPLKYKQLNAFKQLSQLLAKHDVSYYKFVKLT